MYIHTRCPTHIHTHIPELREVKVGTSDNSYCDLSKWRRLIALQKKNHPHSVKHIIEAGGDDIVRALTCDPSHGKSITSVVMDHCDVPGHSLSHTHC